MMATINSVDASNLACTKCKQPLAVQTFLVLGARLRHEEIPTVLPERYTVRCPYCDAANAILRDVEVRIDVKFSVGQSP